MKELLNTGQVLGRNEMKKIMAGSGECALYCDNCTMRCGVTPCYVHGTTMVCDGKTYTCYNSHCV